MKKYPHGITLAAVCNAIEAYKAHEDDVPETGIVKAFEVLLADSDLGSKLQALAENEGYKQAFYEMADILGIGARPDSPKYVFETVMKPALINLEKERGQLAAENAALTSNLMFWDAEDPEMPYDHPDEIANNCAMEVNTEFDVQVAAKMPNRTYRVSEVDDYDCTLELVSGGMPETPATDAYLNSVRADAITSALNASSNHCDTDCVMDAYDCSYEIAEMRSAGAIALHDGLVAYANELRAGKDGE